jgi:hypothetical protein
MKADIDASFHIQPVLLFWFSQELLPSKCEVVHINLRNEYLVDREVRILIILSGSFTNY